MNSSLLSSLQVFSQILLLMKIYGILALSLFSGFLQAQIANEQEGSLNTSTVNSTVDSNNTTDSVTNNYTGAGSSSQIPVGSAITPSYMSNGVETCLRGAGSSISTVVVAISDGHYEVDEDCNRRRDARLLSDLGMKVSAVSRLCQSEANWMALFSSGTPCPVVSNGRLVAGRKNYLLMKLNPELYIPYYGKVEYKRVKKGASYERVPKYTEKQIWFNNILRIGEEDVEEGDDSRSISDRFRTSKSDRQSD